MLPSGPDGQSGKRAGCRAAWRPSTSGAANGPGVGPACEAGPVVVTFDAELWIWDARRTDSWTFVSVPVELSDDIREVAGGPRRGFGAVRVLVTVGGSTWRTSIFPDSARGCYVLPIKRAVRTAEALDEGDVATVTLELVDL